MSSISNGTVTVTRYGASVASAGVDAGGGDATASADDGGQKDVDLVAG
jgi:hypothetical protein